MKEIKQLAGQTMIYGLGTMVPRLLNYFILTPYFTYNLFKNTPGEFGKVTELYTYIAILMVVLTYGMETSYFRFSNSEKNKQKVFNTIFTALIFTSSIFLVLIWVFAHKISIGLKYEGEVIFIKLVAAILAVEAVSAIPFAKLRVENRARRFAILKFVQICLNILLMVGIYNILPKLLSDNSYLLNNEGIVSSRYIFIVNFFVSTIILFLLLPEMKGYSFKDFSYKYFKPILLYGLPLMVSGLAGTLTDNLDRGIYRHLLEDEHVATVELGIYGANYKIGMLLYLFIQMYRYAVEPYFFNKSKDKDAKEQFAQLMNIFIGIIIAMGLFVLLFLHYLKYFISPSFHIGLFIVPYIVVSYMLYGILVNLSVWYKLSGKTQFALIIMIVGTFITITINFIYVPIYRYAASAVAHVFAYSAMVLVSYFLGRKYYPVQYNLKRILTYFIFGFLIYFISLKLGELHWVLDIILRSSLLLIFITFVGWNEKILKEFLNKRNASKNS